MLESVEAGSVEAMKFLGDYDFQDMIPEHTIEKRIQWLDRAWEEYHDYEALYLKAEILDAGDTEPNVDKEIFALISKAYEGGCTRAIDSLSHLYYAGRGTEKNIIRAIELQEEYINAVEKLLRNRIKRINHNYCRKRQYIITRASGDIKLSELISRCIKIFWEVQRDHAVEEVLPEMLKARDML